MENEDTAITHAAEEFGDELTITLLKPIPFPPGPNAVTYDHIDLREPSGAEWEQWDTLSGVKANMKAISVISGLPEGAVKQMKARDIRKAVEFINRFF